MAIEIAGKRIWRLEVTWRDARAWTQGWETMSRKRVKRWQAETLCQSAGFVIADNRKGVMLATTLNPTQVAGVVCIPRRSIMSRRRLR